MLYFLLIGFCVNFIECQFSRKIVPNFKENRNKYFLFWIIIFCIHLIVGLIDKEIFICSIFLCLFNFILDLLWIRKND